MGRKSITISIDESDLEYLKQIGIKVSFVCRNYLSSYVKDLKAGRKPIVFSSDEGGN